VDAGGRVHPDAKEASVSPPTEAMTRSQYEEFIAGPRYTSIGSYPLYLVMQDGEALDYDCAQEQRLEILAAINEENGPHDNWRPFAIDVNYEQDLTCAHCGKQIESAYGVAEVSKGNG
jgi:hypothetical protein